MLSLEYDKCGKYLLVLLCSFINLREVFNKILNITKVWPQLMTVGEHIIKVTLFD